MCLTEVSCRLWPGAPVEDSVGPDAPVPAEPEIPVPFTSCPQMLAQFRRVAGELVGRTILSLRVKFTLDPLRQPQPSFRRRAYPEFPVEAGDWDELAEFCIALVVPSCTMAQKRPGSRTESGRKSCRRLNPPGEPS
jgi:hypothetical protein